MAHPTAQWVIQQFREAIPSDHNYRFIIHDRDSSFSAQVDKSLKKMGVRALKTPVRSPAANAFCERLIGSARRECMDNMIPLSERHVYRAMKEWVGITMLVDRICRLELGFLNHQYVASAFAGAPA